jgi:hypothetical protein
VWAFSLNSIVCRFMEVGGVVRGFWLQDLGQEDCAGRLRLNEE